MNLDHLRAFCVAVEHGGFARAADKLSVQRAAVSKSVKRLEESLGVRLLERSSRAFRTTEAGRSLYERGRALLESSERLAEEVRAARGQVRGELRVAATVDIGTALCREVLPGLQRAHPGLKLSLALSYELEDLLTDDIDVALRVGARGGPNLVGLKLGTLRRGLFASRAYLEARGVPQGPEELGQHSLLGFKARHRDKLVWSLTRGGQAHEIAVEGGFCATNFQALCQAAAGGLGIAALPEDFLREPIRAAGLLKVLPDWSLPRADVTAVYPSRALKPAKLDAFLEAVRGADLFRAGPP